MVPRSIIYLQLLRLDVRIQLSHPEQSGAGGGMPALGTLARVPQPHVREQGLASVRPRHLHHLPGLVPSCCGDARGVLGEGGGGGLGTHLEGRRGGGGLSTPLLAGNACTLVALTAGPSDSNPHGAAHQGGGNLHELLGEHSFSLVGVNLDENSPGLCSVSGKFHSWLGADETLMTLV